MQADQVMFLELCKREREREIVCVCVFNIYADL
jgi:hypothetical protein